MTAERCAPPAAVPVATGQVNASLFVLSRYYKNNNHCRESQRVVVLNLDKRSTLPSFVAINTEGFSLLGAFAR